MCPVPTSGQTAEASEGKPRQGYALRLTEDRLGAGHGRSLPPLNRVLYVLKGELMVSSGDQEARISKDSAWSGPRECVGTAGPPGATVLRYELVRDQPGGAGESIPGVESKLLLQHPIVLDRAEQYLMRCDRVDFDPGGEALPHRHQGGGIRCLIRGSMELRIAGEPTRTIRPGQAWFESGREPVYAAGAADAPTSFIRVSILPRAIRGQSSIMYVDPADARRGKPRNYTVFVDEPIELP
jgi:quercetin dioxygenase-like cupin family protein